MWTAVSTPSGPRFPVSEGEPGTRSGAVVGGSGERRERESVGRMSADRGGPGPNPEAEPTAPANGADVGRAGAGGAGSALVYDWNRPDPANAWRPPKPVLLNDETLRDGLQSPSVVSPPVEKKLEALHLMADLGIHAADIGLPGAGPQVEEQALRLAREIVEHDLQLRPNCAARTVIADIEPIARISEAVGRPIEAAVFIGSSPIRQYAEDWDPEVLLRHTEKAVSWAVAHGLPAMYVTEDTTRARPETVRRLYRTAIESGARRVVVCDTVGHATPDGVTRLLRFVREVIAETGEEVELDWHGHRDRGLSVPNSLTAIEAGADFVHGTAIGIGERCGNTPMDQLLVNLRLLEWIDNDLGRLPDYCRLIAEVTGVPIPAGYPVVGRDAFRTGTGVHAAAIIKALAKGDDWLADRVYSGVPAGDYGLRQRVEVGPMSGLSNVLYWLQQHGYEPTDERQHRVFRAAKEADRVLTDAEIEAVLADR